MAVLLSALWLGILTSISPCPLATNVAAVSFISKKINHPGLVLLSGIAYTLGRTAAYSLLGVLIIASVLNVPAAANFLQKFMNAALGPILVVVGLFLLDVFKLAGTFSPVSEKGRQRLAESGVLGSFALGFIFALSFCPLSAALFFGSLIPLALKNPSGPVLPFVYGVGTGLPVLGFALAMAMGVHSISGWFKALSGVEFWARRMTGAIFIAVGVWFIVEYLLKTIP